MRCRSGSSSAEPAAGRSGWSRSMPRIDWSLSTARQARGEPAGAGQLAPELARYGRGDLPGRPRLGGRARLSIDPAAGCCTVHRLWLFPDCARTELARASTSSPGFRTRRAGDRRSQCPCRFRRFCRGRLGWPAPRFMGRCRQGWFLTALGAGLRLAALSARAEAAQRWSLERGVRRLLDPGEMGELFKVVALVSPGLASPAGFNPSINPGEPA